MKEEAQQGQPAVAINYDVELLHRREAHAELERLGLLSRSTAEDLTGSLMVFSPSATYPTARLVWATPVPKGRWSTFPRTRHASKVTPSAVNSRPSVCLSSYLLQGRNVMLEINVAKGDAEPGAPSVKKTAHTLISHGGHIYIHANDISPHKLLDSQDTRETMKLKRATNARVADFTSLIKETTLRLPNDSEKSYDTQADVLCVQPRRLLLRITRYWPIRSDQSLIYNMSKRFDAFFATIRQPLLTALDADKCKQMIHQLVGLRESKERLTEGSSASRLLREVHSRDEQLQICFAELARHLGNYANHSEQHAEVFLFFLQSTGLERAVRFPNPDVMVMDRTRSKTQDAGSPSFSAPSTSTTSTAASETKNPSRSESPLSKKPRKACYLWKPNETLNLYDYLMEKEERHHRSHYVDFVGRVKAGNRPAHLYPNLESTAAGSAKQE